LKKFPISREKNIAGYRQRSQRKLFFFISLKYRTNSFIIFIPINIKELMMRKIIAFVSTMMLVLLAPGATFLYSTIPLEEREALIALYKATNGDKWKYNSGWKEEPLESDGFGSFGSEGNWKGITISGNHVIKIEFDFQWLKRRQSNWSDTQTTAPTNVSAVSISSSSIKVSWTPIKYKGDTGGYLVYYSTSPRGPWIAAGMTANKLTNAFEITGLSPGKKYYFVVQTRTNPHFKNKNTVVSEYSKDVFATTK
jgi:hypothetical protein